MAVTGTWKATRGKGSVPYTGALRQGTGVNKIHAIHDVGPAGVKSATKLPLGSAEWSGAPPEVLIGPQLWGYCYEDQQFYAGEDYRYLVDDRVGWDVRPEDSPERNAHATDIGDLPQPEGYPSWGVHSDPNPIDGFPLPGQPGGTPLRSYSTGGEYEANHDIAVPTRNSTGGWRNKLRTFQQEAEVSDPGQLVINTSMRQVHGRMSNIRATARETDAPRAEITSRTAGMKAKRYAGSLDSGGGSGSPDMFPFQQTLIMRPFYFRSAGLPPGEVHTMNTAEYRDPGQRAVPPDPYQGAYLTGAYNYSPGDYYGGIGG